MLEIEERYPNIHVIYAHIGRAYCPEDFGNAFELLIFLYCPVKGFKNLSF